MTRIPSARSAALSEEPLLHFVQFLLRTCQRGGGEAGELFDVLRAKYAPVLRRDEGFDGLLDKVGQVFFGREAKKSWLDNLLG